MTSSKQQTCTVCGDSSNGSHCGAITCDACKKFFLRSSVNGEDAARYKCRRNLDCLIDRATRTQCQYCRFKKCRDVGMTVNVKKLRAESFQDTLCAVCSEPASGTHFGAITCKDCSNFFRRSFKHGSSDSFKCLNGDSMCIITPNSKKTCKFCKFQSCLRVGMHTVHRKRNSTTTVVKKEPYHQLFNDETVETIEKLSKCYTRFKFNILTASNIVFVNGYKNTDFVLEMFKTYANSFADFFEAIPGNLILTSVDRNELALNSLHMVVLLILQQECKNLNYFNCTDNLCQKLLKTLPAFSHCTDFLQKMRHSFQILKLDDIEYSLYAALLILSPNASSDSTNFDKISDSREKLADMLNEYMTAQRLEEDTYDDLILLSIGLQKFNKLLQDSIPKHFLLFYPNSSSS